MSEKMDAKRELDKAREELERIIRRVYTEWYGTGTYHGTILTQQLPQAILDRLPEMGFVRLEDVENRLGPYRIMKPVYHKKEKTIIYQEMTEKEKREIMRVKSVIKEAKGIIKVKEGEVRE